MKAFIILLFFARYFSYFPFGLVSCYLLNIFLKNNLSICIISKTVFIIVKVLEFP